MRKQMNSYWDRINKFVIYAFLFIFLFCSILTTPFYGFTNALKFGSLSSLLLILSLVLILTPIDYIALKVAFRKYGIVDYNVRQSREVKLDLTANRVYTYALSAINSLKGVKYIDESVNKREITAETGLNFMTFGEKIAVRIYQNNSEKTLVHISSKPVIPFTVFDYGKNYITVEKIVSSLRAKSGP